MSTKYLSLALLLSCCSFGVMGLSVTEDPSLDPQVASITVTAFLITNINLDISETNATLQFCATGRLPAGAPSLLYGDPPPGTNQLTVDGEVVGDDLNCANFYMDPSFTLPDVPTRYELLLKDPDTSALGRSVSTFSMTAKTSLLTCGPELITKVTWNDPPLSYNFGCITADSPIDKVCYHSGEFDIGEFCFDITDQEDAPINICMNGVASTNVTVDEPTLNYFYYGPELEGSSTASLNLSIGAGDPPNMRAIVRLAEEDPGNSGVPGAATVYDCPSNLCIFKDKDYVRKFTKYEVCVEAIGDNEATTAIGATTFTDMNLHAFDGGSQESVLVEFVFANALDSKMYEASLYQDEPPAGFDDDPLGTVNVDCTGVAHGHACFGFLDSGGGTDIVYLALSEQDGTNTIVTPFDTQPTSALRDDLPME